MPFVFRNMRDEILHLLSGKKADGNPAFSGLIHVTAGGLESEGLVFPEIHRDADKMARAAASTFRLTGFPSAVVPFEFSIPAEALGASVDFREGGVFEFPYVAKPLFESSEAFLEFLRSASHATDLRRLLRKGRLPLVCNAIAQLKREIGSKAVIGGLLTGPYTLLSSLVDPAALFIGMKREPQIIGQALSHLSSFLSQIGHAYKNAGADFLTVHEMAGSPSFLGPKSFEGFVFPALQKLIVELPRPRVLAVCGNVGAVPHLLAQVEAEALSLDQTNDLAALRGALPKALLFGNIDPVAILAQGAPQDVRAAVDSAIAAGVDAVWPGCDLYPLTPLDNLKALVEQSAQMH